MKSLYTFNDLAQYGINPLTGEACAYSMRTLCDLSAAGCALISDFMGLRFNPDDPTAGFNKNWNSRVGERPAIASVMLSRGLIPDLMRFTLFSVEKCDYVVQTPDGGMLGLRETDEYCQSHLALARTTDGYRVWTNFSSAAGSRNQHAFTGRIE